MERQIEEEFAFKIVFWNEIKEPFKSTEKLMSTT